MTITRPLPINLHVVPRPKVECTECAKCCTYVAAGIDAPDTVKDAGHLLWYLYHPGVSVYTDGNGDWSVVFESRCRNLREDRLCGIYETRPPICRDFDSDCCDVNDPADGKEFFEPQSFLAWLATERPVIHRLLGRGYVPEALRPAAAVPARLRR